MKYVVWYVGAGIWQGTDKLNYDSIFMDANKVLTYTDFDSFDELRDYIHTYVNKDIIVEQVK